MKRALLVALAAASAAAAQDRTYVDVGSPNFQPLPIAVASFQGEGDVRGADVSDVVRSDAATNLNELAKNLSKYGDTNLLIVGHTDAVGSPEYNQNLSERRAQSAARYLAAQGVTRHIATSGLGEREPVAANTTEAGRQQNRRIEIAIYASAALQEDARRQAAGR